MSRMKAVKVKAVANAEPEQTAQPAPQKTRSRFWGDLGMLLFKIALVAAFLVVIFTFFFGVAQQRDFSMRPALQEGDLAVYYRLERDYEKEDLVVLKTEEGETQVRRLIALPGDTVDITEEGLLLNGYRQVEEKIYSETLPYTDGPTYPLTVPDGYWFVLGDNRDSADDSRHYGLVSQADVKGRVVTQLRRRSF